MQFVCGLLYCTLSHCFVYLSHCLLCTRFRFCYSFYDCLFFVPFASTLCVLHFPLSCTVFLLMYICSFLFVYSFTDRCHRVKTQLQLINAIHKDSSLVRGWSVNCWVTLPDVSKDLARLERRNQAVLEERTKINQNVGIHLPNNAALTSQKT
jgi:hypothetical protein